MLGQLVTEGRVELELSLDSAKLFQKVAEEVSVYPDVG